MEDHYGMADLRQFMNSANLFTSIPPPPPPPPQQQQTEFHYEMVMAPPQPAALHHHTEFLADSTTTASGGAGFSGLELESAAGGFGCDGATGRWPRQETLTLLEIRSRLDSKFKEANQKGPLWDEVSRIMSEEHGYQRSGKKCREKFENLYKYYKKTKEGKAGRQDGKHYRFFRQLEALYGETSNNLNNTTPEIIQHQPGGNNNFFSNNNNNVVGVAGNHDSLSLSNYSSDFELMTSSGDSAEKAAGGKKRKSWKCKIKDFIDQKMRKLMEKQEAWLEKMMNTIEQKEKERMLREEEWRKQEVARMDREQKFWATERAWMEARDAALMEALHKITGKEIIVPKFRNVAEHILEEENIDHIKRRKENSGNCFAPHNSFPNNNDHIQHGGLSYSADEHPGNASSPNHSGFRFLMGDNNNNNNNAEILWENFVLKSSKGPGENN